MEEAETLSYTAMVYTGGMNVHLKKQTFFCDFSTFKRYLEELNFTIFNCRHFVSDSDDSDTEGGLGNVERVVMRPPGHSGKAKRGHLCFDSSFETGMTK